VQSYTYEITFAGRAGDGLRAEFDDCEITAGQDSTTLRADLPDQAALAGLVLRITSLRLKVTHLRLVAPPASGDLAWATPGVNPDVSHAGVLSRAGVRCVTGNREIIDVICIPL